MWGKIKKYRALSDLFSLFVLSGNAAWRRFLVARERENSPRSDYLDLDYFANTFLN
jgi:hypothetical protein